MNEALKVVVGAGSLRAVGDGIVDFPHRWTEGGVSVEATFTGAHLLHLAVAGCVLNDVYREAAARNIALDGVRVTASGDFDPATWESTGIDYSIDVESSAARDVLAEVLAAVDEVAEIPRAIRAGASVSRI